jgi:hypothetical protein
MGAFALSRTWRTSSTSSCTTSLDFRLEQFEVVPGSPHVGATVRELAADLPNGILLLALRRPGQALRSQPVPGGRH